MGGWAPICWAKKITKHCGAVVLSVAGASAGDFLFLGHPHFPDIKSKTNRMHKSQLQPAQRLGGGTGAILNGEITAAANGAGATNSCTGPAAPNAPYHPRRAYSFNVKHGKLPTSKVTFRPAPLRSSGDRQAGALISFSAL